MRSYYNSTYKNNPDLSRPKPNKLIKKIMDRLPNKAEVLDLGCGQGRDSLYIARHTHKVTSVDNSEVAVSQINNFLKKNKAGEIHTICQDIEEFKIKPKKFNLINCHNALQFLSKESALRVIEDIKQKIICGGYIIITSFVSDKQTSNKNMCRFNPEEMRKIFLNPKFEILHYFEGKFFDKGHIGRPKPHIHRIVEIIARKIR